MGVYLSCVSIPNKELMDKFAEMAQKEAALESVYRLTRESGRMLVVGIAYNKADKTKRHECKVEVLRERLQ